MTRRACILAVLIIFSLSTPRGAAPVHSQTTPDAPVDTLQLGLDDAIRIALQNNEEIGIAEAGLDRAKGTRKQATAAALPHLGFSARYTRNIQIPVIFFNDPASNEVIPIEIGQANDYLMNFSLDQVVYAFGRVGGAIKAADYYLKSNEAALESTKQDVRLQTEVAYYDALFAVEVRRIAIQSLDAAEKHFEETKRKLRQNMSSRFDSVRAEVEVKNREPEVLNAENAIRIARLNLKRVMGIDRTIPIALTDTLVFEPEVYSLDEAIREAQIARPDIQALRLHVAMTDKLYSVQKRWNLPYLSLFGSYNFQAQTSNDLIPPSDSFIKSFGLGLSLTFPIFDGLENRGKVAQAQADLSAAKYTLKRLENVVALAINELYDQMGAEEKNLRSQQATVGMAEEAYRLALVRFTNGLSTNLELEDTELALTSSRLNYSEAVYRYMVAKKRFEYAMGH